MLCHLVSTDPDNYNTVKFTSSIGKINDSILYRINSISFIASFSITTEEDYLLFASQGIDHTIHFKDKGRYDLPYDLSIDGFTITMNDKGCLIFSASEDFIIKDATHNVKLLLGLYHSNLPIQAKAKITGEYEIEMPSIPYRSYGNVLYLMARTDMICSVNNKEGKEESLSIAYKTNEILYPGFPVICKIPSQWSIIHSSQLNQLEFTLVDFQFQPVKLHSPLYITLEINSSNNF